MVLHSLVKNHKGFFISFLLRQYAWLFRREAYCRGGQYAWLLHATVMPIVCASSWYGLFTVMNFLSRVFSFLNNVARRATNAFLHPWSNNMRDVVECCNPFDTWRIVEFHFTAVYRLRERRVIWRDFGGGNGDRRFLDRWHVGIA